MRRPAVIALLATLLAACAPARVWDTHTTSTSRLESPKVAQLAHERVATLGPLAPASLQGLNPFLSHGLVAALAEVTPPIRASPVHEVANRLNAQGLAGEYAELIAGYTRSGILDRDRLRRIGSALGSRYVLLPGVAELNHSLVDRFETAGFKLVRNQVTTLRLWLQLWDVQVGRIAWESVGEVTVVNPILSAVHATPLDVVAQTLWRRMLQDDLVSQRSERSPSPLSVTRDDPDARVP
jgi:hypothetical protein